MKNPVLVLLIIVLVMVTGLVLFVLFGKQKVQLDNGLTGKSGFFLKTTSPADVVDPIVEPANPTA
jgi:hypothetical protein